MKRQALNILPIVFIVFVTCLIFFKIFLRGLYPVPGDLLVSFYFPWYSGGWQGYNPWTTHKELLGADSIRQIYPWKEFAANQFKASKIPLWNPYTFSGQPLIANFQSSVFYPLNIFYFVTNPQNAWILLIVTQPLLGGIFMYIAVKSFKISKIAATLAAVAFMFSSYLITWMENGNIAHGYIWLPLAIWAINRLFESSKLRYFVILILSQAMAIFAGHPQTAIYLYLAIFVYFIYKIIENGQPLRLALWILSVVFSLGITSIQLMPTYDFYKDSPIYLPFAKEVFDRSIIPYKNLITFFASDFFGHPANNNFWSQTYGDFTPYFGVIPLVFALWAILRLHGDKFVKFATIASIIFIFSSVPGPITYLIKTLRLPLLDATTPSRFISISIFFLIILSAMGLDDLIKNIENNKYRQKFFIFSIPIAAVYLSLWSFAIFGQFFLEPKATWVVNLAVTRRNLILPTALFLSVPLGILIFQFLKTKLSTKRIPLVNLLIFSFLSATILGGIYYSNKFLPVSPKKFIFPDHFLFDWIKENANLYRFYGGGTAHIDFNFPTHYQIYGAEGYDTLRLRRYAELLSSSFEGYVPKSYLRSDGVFPNEENGYRKRLFELLGVKYLLDKEDNPKTGADWHFERFPNDDVSPIWQSGKFQTYERKPVLPRVFLTTKYYVAQNDQEIIKMIYDPNFNLETLILEEKPPIEVEDIANDIIIPRILKYDANEVSISTNQNYNSLLFLSDAYSDDWRVYVDGHEQKLLRTHYALRSVAVPNGDHQVLFKYQPKSFTYGFYTSLTSVIALILISLYLTRERKF